MEPQIGIIVVILLIVVIVTTKAGIYYLLAVLIPLFPAFRIRTSGNIPIYFIDVILLIGLFEYCLLSFRDKGAVDTNRYGPWLLLIFISGIISYLVGVTALGNPLQYSTYALIRTLLPLTGFLWAYRLFSKDRAFIGKTVSIFIVSSTLMALLGMGLFFKYGPVIRLTKALAPLSDSLEKILTQTQLGGRLVYDIEPATVTGCLLLFSVFTIACLYAVPAKNRRLNTVLLSFALTMTATALVLTFSRSAIAGFFLGLIIFVFIVARRRGYSIEKRAGRIIIVIAFIIAMAFGAFVVVKAIDRGDPYALKYKLHFGIEGEEVRYGKESRIEMVASSLENMAKDPVSLLLGNGMGTLMIGDRTGKDFKYTEYYAHNFYSVHLMYWGLLATVVFLLLCISLLIKIRRYFINGLIEDSTDAILADLLLCLLPALLLTFFGEHAYVSRPAINILLWFLLGAGSYVVTKYRESMKAMEAKSGSQGMRK